jgi:hypothetical protein
MELVLDGWACDVGEEEDGAGDVSVGLELSGGAEDVLEFGGFGVDAINLVKNAASI